MKKSVEATLASRFYARYSWDILTNLANVSQEQAHPLLKVRKVKKVAIVFITSNKGLCGSYNSSIMKKVVDQIKNPQSLMINRILDKKIESDIKEEELEVDFICIGSKGAELLNKMNKNIIEVFTDINEKPKLRDIKPIAESLIDKYSKGEYDKIVVAYTDYYSAVKQEPKIRQLLPLSKIDLAKIIDDLSNVDEKFKKGNGENEIKEQDYLYEPNQKELLESILPKLVEMQLYQMIMESNASEQSARMVAMKNASDAADEMIDELTLIYNKARQSAITQELAEISAGKAALENN
jgi:F-type H+-transporting ATPase subunit gamma